MTKFKFLIAVHECNVIGRNRNETKQPGESYFIHTECKIAGPNLLSGLTM